MAPDSVPPDSNAGPVEIVSEGVFFDIPDNVNLSIWEMLEPKTKVININKRGIINNLKFFFDFKNHTMPKIINPIHNAAKPEREWVNSNEMYNVQFIMYKIIILRRSLDESKTPIAMGIRIAK